MCKGMLHVESFVVGVVDKMPQNVGMVKSIVLISCVFFSFIFEAHLLAFIQKTFCDFFLFLA